MDRVTYRQLIMDLLRRHTDLIKQASGTDLHIHCIFDETHDRYMLFKTGWRGKEHIHRVFLYIYLRNDKIWIEEDWTEDGLATELLKAGVPHNNIVLGFRHPELRSLTEFAVA